jgi:hypothetical protein
VTSEQRGVIELALAIGLGLVHPSLVEEPREAG